MARHNPLHQALALASIALGLLACGNSQKGKVYAFTLLAESDPGEPLNGVQLARSGKKVAESGADGSARLSLSGAEGQRVAFAVTCPPGTTPYEPEVTTTLRSYEGGTMPELLVRCAPNERELTVVAMFEKGAGLPIQHRLRTLAVTDQDGVAHFALRGKPGETFELVINTEAQPGLRPANPAASLTIGGRDDAQVLERSFMPPKEKPKPRARGPVLPKRIN
jgi:hypothetical protein